MNKPLDADIIPAEIDAEMMAHLQHLDGSHHLHPFTDSQTVAQNPPFIIDRAQGLYVGGQGFELLDAMAGLGCVNIGYGRQEMADTSAAVMKRLNFYHNFAAVAHPYGAKLAGKIAEMANMGDARVFFGNSGSEANETLVKLAWAYWRLKGQEEKRIILSRDYAYHGSGIFSAALNGNRKMIDDFGLMSPDIDFAMAPYWFRNSYGEAPPDFGIAAAEAMAAKIDAIGPDKVAAVIAEPIQGTAGAIVPPDTYWPRLAEICKERDVLLIADEVVTGFGRTGHWFAKDAFGFEPDMMTLAKGLSSAYTPISAAVVGEKVMKVLHDKMGLFQHGYTTSAHPVAAALALKNIEILEEESLVSRIKEDIGPYFEATMRRLEAHPLAGEVRVKGLICGIEIAKDRQARTHYPTEFMVDEHIGNACIRRGLLVRPVGNAIVLCPPFILQRRDVELILRVLQEAMDEIYAALKEQGYA